MTSRVDKRSIALVTAHGWVSISTSVLNTAAFWAHKGYNVDIFMSEDERCKHMGLPEFDNICIKVIPSRESWYLHRCLKKMPLQWEIPHLYKHLEFFIRRSCPSQQYDILIGFDFGGLIRAMLLGKLWGIPYIYHSLELTHNIWLRRWEQKCARDAMCVLIQDDVRAKLLQEKLHLKNQRFYYVRNSPIGGVIRKKKNYFRDKFGIPANKKLVLATGSLIVEHSIDNIINSVEYWPSEYVLVIHGWFSEDNFRKQVMELIELYKDRIYVSEDFLKPRDKYLVFQSVNYGIVSFEPLNDNLKYTVGSAGKLFDFMRVGVPILGYNLPGMREYIEEPGCGLVFSCFSEIGEKLTTIAANYQIYSEQAFQTYQQYEFSGVYRDVYDEIQQLITQSKNIYR